MDASAAAAGKLGLSTSRFVDEARSDLAVPPSAEWRPVTVAFRRYGRECRYQQPFLPSGARLCINCAAAVPGKAAGGPPETVLDGMTLLFCGWVGRGADGGTGLGWQACKGGSASC